MQSAAAAFAPAAAGRPLAPAPDLLVHDAQLRIVGRRLGAVLPLPLLGTVAVVVRLGVEARRGVPAGIRAAVVPVDLTLIASEADRADALVSVHQIPALAPVLTGLRGALVVVHVAILARVSCCAAAVIIIHQIDAERPVLALADAVVNVLRAVLPREASCAATPETPEISAMRGAVRQRSIFQDISKNEKMLDRTV